MKKRILLLIIASIITFIVAFNWSFFRAVFSVLASYMMAVDMEYVQKNQWSYDEGFKIGVGDFLEFSESDSTFSLRGDTVLYKGEQKAIIIRLNKYFNQLEVSSIDGLKKGTYTNTEEFTK